MTDEQVDELREVGWSDEQIAEAVYDAALFNLFVRLADAFGIEPPADYEPEGFWQRSRGTIHRDRSRARETSSDVSAWVQGGEGAH